MLLWIYSAGNKERKFFSASINAKLKAFELLFKEKMDELENYSDNTVSPEPMKLNWK
ncbi:MAG: hypothetical protein ACKVOU_10450 [Cytophagales bacterium]